jgi:hypothetical protein
MHRYLTILLLAFSGSALAGEVVFEGYPVKKIEMTEQTTASYDVPKSKASEYRVVIEREGENYYWRSRENLQLVRTQSGVYVTYLAANGSGYIRVLNDAMREMYKLLTDEEKQNNYLYMEHLVHRLGSITYYGR